MDNFTRKITNVRVIDGDTIECDIDLGFHIKIREKVRLLGVNTPERGKEGFDDATQFTLDYFFKIFTSPEVEYFLTSKKQGSFKRWLGVINRTGSEKSLNDKLVDLGLGVRYE